MRVFLFVSAAFAAAVALVAQAGCSTSNGSQGGGSDASQSEAGGDSADDGGGFPCPPIHQSDADLTTPTVSFRNDVMPIFSFTCATSVACHGGDPGTAIARRGLFLGCSAVQLDSGMCHASGDIPEQVYQSLVGDRDAGPDAGPNKPIEIDRMPFVTAGDPSKSFLIHKIDGDQCNLTGCLPNNAAVENVMDTPGTSPLALNWCGQPMPYNAPALSAGAVCGGDADCANDMQYSVDTIRAWVAQGAQNN